jgi:hypothetical protein
MVGRHAGGREAGPTVAQRRAWSDLGQVSAAWATLTDEQRQAWNAYARADRRGSRVARRRRPSGQRAFVKVNLRRKALGQELLASPPGAESRQPFPAVRFFVTNTDGRIALKLIIAYGSAEGVMVSSWHPLSAGVMVWDKFVRLGLLPGAVRGVRDLTELYGARFGMPLPGKKIFIRVRQMNDYQGSMMLTASAVVPPWSSWVGRPKAA